MHIGGSKIIDVFYEGATGGHQLCQFWRKTPRPGLEKQQAICEVYPVDGAFRCIFLMRRSRYAVLTVLIGVAGNNAGAFFTMVQR